MTEEFDHIDKLLQNKLNDFQVESSPEDLAKFQKKLSGFRFISFHWNSFNLYYVIGLVGILVACLMFVKQSFEKNDLDLSETPQTEKIQNINSKVKKANIHSAKSTNSNFSENNTKLEETQTSEKKTNFNKPENNQQPPEDSVFTEKTIEEQNNNSDESKNTSTDNQTKVVVFDTIQTEQTVIIYDTVKTVIIKTVKPDKKNH